MFAVTVVRGAMLLKLRCKRKVNPCEFMHAKRLNAPRFIRGLV
jgi:hypothetical protein